MGILAQDDRDVAELQAMYRRAMDGVQPFPSRATRGSDPAARATTDEVAVEAAAAPVDAERTEPVEAQRTEPEPERVEPGPAPYSEEWRAQKLAEAAQYRQTAVEAVYRAEASLQAASAALPEIDVPTRQEAQEFLELARDRDSGPEGQQRFVDAASALKDHVQRGQAEIQPVVDHLTEAAAALEEAKAADVAHSRAPLNTLYDFRRDEVDRLQERVDSHRQLVEGAAGNLANSADYLDEFVLDDGATGTGEDLWHTANSAASARGILDSAKAGIDASSIRQITRERPEELRAEAAEAAQAAAQPAQGAQVAADAEQAGQTAAGAEQAGQAGQAGQVAAGAEQDLRLRAGGNNAGRRGQQTGR